MPNIEVPPNLQDIFNLRDFIWHTINFWKCITYRRPPRKKL